MSTDARYFSQYGQDRFVFERFFRGVDRGVFLDVGADDGVDKSNTKFFEELGWTGLCVEPSPSRFSSLRANRRAECLNVAIASRPGEVEFLDMTGWGKGLSGIVAHYDPRHVERIERETTNNPLTASKTLVRVPAVPLATVLEARGLRHIHYASIDVEGSELDVLASIDWTTTTIDVLRVEDNYADAGLQRVLAERGYVVVAALGQDLVFAKER